MDQPVNSWPLLRMTGHAGFKLDAAEYSYISSGNIAGAEKAGVWDRLGPITRVVFEKYPKVRRALINL